LQDRRRLVAVPAPAGQIDPPASPSGFHRSAAEAAADRYFAIMATPARDGAAASVPHAAPKPALLAQGPQRRAPALSRGRSLSARSTLVPPSFRVQRAIASR
jgi:hypothetical protein